MNKLEPNNCSILKEKDLEVKFTSIKNWFEINIDVKQI